MDHTVPQQRGLCTMQMPEYQIADPSTKAIAALQSAGASDVWVGSRAALHSGATNLCSESARRAIPGMMSTDEWNHAWCRKRALLRIATELRDWFLQLVNAASSLRRRMPFR